MGQTTFTPDSIYVTGAGLVGRSSSSGLCSLLDAAAIRTVAGLGTMATQAAASYLALSGGTLTGGLVGTTAAFSGNASVGGTLGVTGAATFGGNVTLSGTVQPTIKAEPTTGGDIRMYAGSSLGIVGTFGATALGLKIYANGTERMHFPSTTGSAVLVTSSLQAGADSTYDIGGTSSLRFRDLHLSRNANIGGTLGVTGAATFSSTITTAGLSSTSALRSQGQLVGSWVDSTDATRKAQVEEKVYDTAARTVARSFANGTNGYKAFKVLTTAPADADLAVSEVVFYTNGSGHLAIKLKDSGGTVRTGTVTLT